MREPHESDRYQALREQKMVQLLSAALGGQPEHISTPFYPHASPSWRGVDADIRLGERKGKQRLIKYWHPETSFYITPERSVLAAQHASQLGVGPWCYPLYKDDHQARNHIHHSSAATFMIMEFLGGGWRVAGLQDMENSTLREAVIMAKTRFQQASWSQPEALPSIDPFDEVITLANTLTQQFRASTSADKAGIFYPPELSDWLDFVINAQQVVHSLGRDEYPSHRESEMSNLMVHESGRICLLDYDSAACSDRYEDVGLFLFEAFDNEQQAREGFEQWLGYFDEGEFQRAWLYGVLDDLRWGVIASLRSALSPRSSLEFAKYAGWRFLRARSHLQCDWQARVRHVR